MSSEQQMIEAACKICNGASIRSAILLLVASSSQAQLLCSAVSRGDITQLTYLLKAGADANAADYDKHTAMHVAAAESNMQAVS